MIPLKHVVNTFPSAVLPSQSGGLPVEVSLIAQLGPGSGNHLFESVSARQRGHHAYVDALEEPSARLGATDLARGDPTALYSFCVGAGGHPFHRHAGHRIFTAISGSGGAQLRFSSASPAQLDTDPRQFLRALRYINVPPDCLFTVRFGGDTWHQFAPLQPKAVHPAFFALSCHTNELGGALSEAQRKHVLDNAGSIPLLTELLPDGVLALLQREPIDPADVTTTTLSVDSAPDTLHDALCSGVRSRAGTVRARLGRRRGSTGYVEVQGRRRGVSESPRAPIDSLLHDQFDRVDHEDFFTLVVDDLDTRSVSAQRLLATLLDGFLQHSPVGVARMMALRNVLVKPLGLRTSPLGCPVSSLLSPRAPQLFAQRFPVLGQRIDVDDRHAQVLLGANDRHLDFRSCAAVRVLDYGGIAFTLGTRVCYRNRFGRMYMTLIDRVHRGYISPAMLQRAVEHVVREVTMHDLSPMPPLSSAQTA